MDTQMILIFYKDINNELNNTIPRPKLVCRNFHVPEWFSMQFNRGAECTSKCDAPQASRASELSMKQRETAARSSSGVGSLVR
jgi:hypothetical protein